MDLYAAISQRKSCRKYDPQPLEQELLQEIDAAIQGFEPLDPDAALSWRFIKKVKGKFHVEAPHYVIISGQGKQGESENAGFVFEQLALWLDCRELGCVWLGASEDAQTGRREGDLLAIGFGRTTEPVHREKDAFKRKPIEQITNAPDDPCMQAVRLAPSGLNLQPWYFERQAQRVLVYRQKGKLPVSLFYKHSAVDMGIALCHYALACREIGKPFRFAPSQALPDKAGFLPFGILT